MIFKLLMNKYKQIRMIHMNNLQLNKLKLLIKLQLKRKTPKLLLIKRIMISMTDNLLVHNRVIFRVAANR